MAGDFLSLPSTQLAVRTLLAAGFTLHGSHSQPRHIELICQRIDILGATIPYLIAVSDCDELSIEEIDDIKRSAENQNRVPLIVTRFSTPETISWEDFTEALGGVVPSWNALNPTYNAALVVAATNVLPQDMTGDAWLVFEDLVGDGFEFIFGRRVRRLGGRKRGHKLSDMLAQIPQGSILVIDSKAAQKGFDATWPALRPLVDYVRVQRRRQQGQLEIFSAVIVSSDFVQENDRLDELTKQFYAEAQVPLAFLDAKTLSSMVSLLRGNPYLRNAIRWTFLLSGGRVLLKTFEQELAAAVTERMSRGG